MKIESVFIAYGITWYKTLVYTVLWVICQVIEHLSNERANSFSKALLYEEEEFSLVSALASFKIIIHSFIVFMVPVYFIKYNEG